MEIEAKFAVRGTLDPESLARLDLAPYTLQPLSEQHLRNVILDTAARAITGAGHALRLRTINGEEHLLTYKGPNAGSDGTHQREEIEVPVPDGAQIDPRHWPARVQRPVRALIGTEPLEPLLRIDVHRRRWRIERDGAEVAELALDEGTIFAGGQTAPLHELEVELHDGADPQTLDDLRPRLLAALPLAPEPRSKLQQGLALLGAMPTEAPAEPPEQPAPMTGATPLTDLARHVLGEQLRKLRAAEPIARAGSDPEGVHDMRVATRRLRTMLQILEGAAVFQAKRLRRLRRDLRPLARLLGAVRDADVLAARIEAAEASAPEGLAAVRVEVTRQRQAAHTALLKYLGDAKYTRILDRLEAFLTAPDLHGHDGHDAHDEVPTRVRHFAGSALWQRVEAVLRFEDVVATGSVEELHALRITCKRLRYALELFAEPLGSGAKPLAKTLVQAQDHLGTLQDLVVAHALASALAEAHPGQDALRAYAATLATARDEHIAAVATIWEPLRAPAFRARLATCVAAL